MQDKLEAFRNEYKRLKPKMAKYKSIFDLNRLGTPEKVGKCMELIKQCNPINYNDWEKYYFKYIDKEIIYNIGERYFNLIKKSNNFSNDVTLRDCKIMVYLKKIYMTWIGYNRENQIKEYLQTKNIFCYKPTFYDDCNLGVDFNAVDKNKNEKFALQIKPNSFLCRNASADLVKDRINFFKKEKLLLEKYNLKLLFITYDNNSDDLVIVHELFNLNEKIDKNGDLL